MSGEALTDEHVATVLNQGALACLGETRDLLLP